MRTEVKANSAAEMREIERKLKETGYQKTADCMWAKIYNKGNIEITVSREF